MEFVFNGQKIDDKKLNETPWLKFLYLTKEHRNNPERVSAMADMIEDNLVLDYVERSLVLLQSHSELSKPEMHLVETTLKWSEVAKTGMPAQRRKWQGEGLSLEIHNEASAQIYRKNQNEDDNEDTIYIIYTLIDTHGLLGQYIRGENNFSLQQPLADLIEEKRIKAESLERILVALNHCLMAAAGDNIWQQNEKEIRRLITIICQGKISEENQTAEERMQKLFPSFRLAGPLTEPERMIYEKVMGNCDLWYSEVALESFSRNEINTIFGLIQDELATQPNVTHISFYPLAQNLLYDYQGKKKVNVYKKRICELCFKELSEHAEDEKFKEHVSVKMEVRANTLYFDVVFTPVCAALINFCEEAEKSGLISYEKNIQNIFDLFGFRRDIFDRLNNEEIYLSTMDDVTFSSKSTLLDFVIGNSVADVGSGSGVLLDLLEQRYPAMNIIGTDISANVIENLQHKIINENHHYQVIRHNFVDGPLSEPVDNILFSSILHEIYSYNEMDGQKFNLKSVRQALKNAVMSLNENGRIIIRDGIRCNQQRISSVRFKNEEGIRFCENYLHDFKGLKEYRLKEDETVWNNELVHLEKDLLTGKPDFIREALYTYTWGSDSYSQEVQEQFGYLTLLEYEQWLEELNMTILVSRCFTEPGYPQHLDPLVELIEPLNWDDLPSTCIIVAQKRKQS